MIAPWMLVANHLKGVSEVQGAVTNPKIDEMFRISGHGWVDDDETPWCAAFVGACLRLSGFASSGKLNAKSYIDFGEKLAQPRFGCVVVFTRGAKNAPTGHVAFYEQTRGTGLVVLGGNQGNAVSSREYPKSRVVGYFWPTEVQLPAATSRILKNIIELDPDASSSEMAEVPTPAADDVEDGADDGFVPLSMGSKNSQVKALQQSLIELGYYLGADDGDFGPRTRDALMAFQSDQGLSPTGVADTATLAAFANASPRKEGAARAAASEADLRAKNSRTIKSADIGGWLGIATAVLGALGISDKYLGFLGGLSNTVKGATGAPVDAAPAMKKIAEMISAAVKNGEFDASSKATLEAAMKTIEAVSGKLNPGASPGILGSLTDLLQGLLGPGSSGSLLLLLGAGTWMWRQSKVIKTARVDDHRSGKNLGK